MKGRLIVFAVRSSVQSLCQDGCSLIQSNRSAARHSLTRRSPWTAANSDQRRRHSAKLRSACFFVPLASGYGDGDGDGSGSGYAYGSGEGYFAAILSDSVSGRISALLESGAKLAFWRSDSNGKPCNNGTGLARTVGMVEELPGPLKLCGPGALHGTLQPWKWKGERLWVVLLYPPVEESEDKLGSLKREIVAEIPNFF